MSLEIKVPAVGESVTSGLIAQWHKQNGEAVANGDILFTLETDKVSTEIGADGDGVLEILVNEGEEVEIGTVVAKINEGEGSPAPTTEAPSKTESAPPAEEAKPEEAPTEEPSGGEEKIVEVKVPAVGESVSSGVLAQWHKQDGEAVAKDDILFTLETDKVSTEITADDPGVLKTLVAEGDEVEIGAVVATIAVGAGAPAAAPAKKESPAETKSTPAPEAKSETAEAAPKQVADESRVTRKKLSPLRRKIATHLVSAQQTAAILTTFNEVDMSAVMQMRKDLKEAFLERHGVKLGFMSFFIKAVVEALKEVPQVNARMDGDELVVNHFYDIGVAVGTEKGLIVPVVRDCDQKSPADIEKAIIEYAVRARDGKIQYEDLQGGVFTISNGGVYGSMLSTPILNPPQSGILGLHNIQERPMAENGKVVIRPMMYLALSYDHRIVDGKEAVTFLIKVKEFIESPVGMLGGV
ncbi:MAG: dihydrolipoyllysine-residue succinyltransferase [Verrucomicrobiota bacterium]